MGWSLKIANIAGIEVKLHATFFLILIFYGWIYYLDGGLGTAAYGILFVTLLFLCILLHEFGHALAAKAFGIRTPDITLLPIGGLARLERMPANPWQEFIISIAGPSVNLAIIAALLPFVPASINSGDFQSLDSAKGSLVNKLFAVNVILVAFNLIPAFPMDGGRILRSVLAATIPHSRATLIAVRTGQVFAVLFGLIGLLGNPLLTLIAFFIFLGAEHELKISQFLRNLADRKVGDVMSTDFTSLQEIHEPSHIAAIARLSSQQIYPVVDSSLQVLGLVSQEDFLNQQGALRPRNVPTLTTELSTQAALEIMRQTREPVLPVVNPSGQLVGLFHISCLTKK